MVYFPFTPYPQQELFMQHVLEFLGGADHRVAILESPTGSGKSLSLICSLCHWLENRGGDDALDWVAAFEREELQRREREQRVRRIKRLESEDMNRRAPRRGLDPSLDWSGLLSSEDEPDDPLPAAATHKVIYCSRTHSQISQFVREIKKTKYADTIKVVSLGSRKALCINSSVKGISSQAALNERCIELVQTGSRKKTGTGKVIASACPNFDGKIESLQPFADRVLSRVHDIEDEVKAGESCGCCPYYGTRLALLDADIVTMPYSMLVHRKTRESLGIELEGAVVVVDEAHNIIETLNEVYSVTLTLATAEDALGRVQAYTAEHKNRLLHENKKRIEVLTLFLQHMTKLLRDTAALSEVTSVNDLLVRLHLDNVNMYDLESYFVRSKFFNKTKGYGEEPSNAVRDASQFLVALMNESGDGKLLSRSFDGEQMGNTCIKYLMLNATRAFQEIVTRAKAVILTGGTMQPFSFYEMQLFPSDRTEVDRFSCDHVIDPGHVLGLVVPMGPTRVPFSFTYANRDKKEQDVELGRAIANLCTTTPGGMVCFFQSFDRMDRILQVWKEAGVYLQIDRKKTVMKEPRGGGAVQQCLDQFTKIIRERGGGLLCSVVGGKMSEGINFSDDLARCVVMVGLPYPNKGDPELQQRLLHFGAVSGHRPEDYYQILCMRAVNQSIGRAIRHRGDYASIVLLDQRFSNNLADIPAWIRRRTSVCGSFGEAAAANAAFFRGHSHAGGRQSGGALHAAAGGGRFDGSKRAAAP